MNLENFKAICSYMLQKHYGIQLVDTHYGKDSVCQRELAYDIRPHEALNEYAEDFAALRIDVQERPGQRIALTIADEQAAMSEALSVVEATSSCMYCSCGSKTRYLVMKDRRQHHTCMNRSCRREFIATDEIAHA